MEKAAQEFVGLTRQQALRRAAKLHLVLRDVTESGWYTADLARDRVNVRFNASGLVESANLY